MRNIPNPPVVTIGIILSLGIIGGSVLAGCGKKVDTSGQKQLPDPVAAPDRIGSMLGYDNSSYAIHEFCFKGLQFIARGQAAASQVMDTTGKPMECK